MKSQKDEKLASNSVASRDFDLHREGNFWSLIEHVREILTGYGIGSRSDIDVLIELFLEL